MKIAVCDDEQTQTELLTGWIRQWALTRRIRAEVGSYESAESLMTAWQELRRGGGGYDLLVLDIQMPGEDGMSLARRIRETDEQTGILFVTGYEDYMAQGYEVEAFRYLLKPVSEEKLWEALDQFERRRQKRKPQLVVETSEGNRRLDAGQILYAEAFAHTCEIWTKQERVTARIGISELEEQGKALGIPFFRCHRSYSVNLKWVSRIEKDAVILTDGRRVPVSRRMYQGINQAFIAYFTTAR